MIDATAIPADRGGVGRYVDGIVDALVALDCRLTVVCQPRDERHFVALGADVVAAPARIERVLARMVWEQLSLPRLAKRLGVDVVHSPHYTFPLLMRTASAVTVHDLTFFTLPEAHSTVKRYFFRWWIRTIARRRLAVIADSQSTADDFASIAKGSPDRVTVSHLGYDESLFHRPDDTARAALRAAVPALPHSWIAFLGTLEPRKNVVALIDGYTSAMVSRDGDRPALLLAGGDGWDEGVSPAIERATAAGVDVRKLGYLPLDTLSPFLGGSTVFVYPSLGEGFGLPVLEAMATGACVLTTDLTSLPEVGGDAVAYTGVSASAIADALRGLLDDEPKRAALSAAAVDRAAAFTWEAAARRHSSAYAMAVNA